VIVFKILTDELNVALDSNFPDASFNPISSMPVGNAFDTSAEYSTNAGSGRLSFTGKLSV
jgi:hypothetical protein